MHLRVDIRKSLAASAESLRRTPKPSLAGTLGSVMRHFFNFRDMIFGCIIALGAK